MIEPNPPLPGVAGVSPTSAQTNAGSRKSRRLLFVLLLLLLLGGCASMPNDGVRQAFLQGQPEAALAQLDQQEHSTRNALLELLERGLILHNLGKYEDSTKAFLKAEKKLDEWDYVSVSDQAKTLVTSDWAGIYKGEYSERLWIHSYQMMNYLLLGDPEKAAVEARMALKVLDGHGDSLKKDLFTRALIALSFESAGKYNDAFIEYRKLADLLPTEKLIARELYWTALRSGITSAAEKYRAMLSTSKMKTDPDELGEIIIFVAHGVLPQKQPADLLVAPDIRISFPQYPLVDTVKPRYIVEADGRRAQVEETTTLLLDVAREALHARGKQMLAKQAARASLKHNLAHELKKENEAAGQILSLLFFLLEEADTRGWSTLPETLSLLRIPLAPGTHDIVVTAKDGTPNGRKILQLDGVTIERGQRLFRKLRID